MLQLAVCLISRQEEVSANMDGDTRPSGSEVKAENTPHYITYHPKREHHSPFSSS